MRNRKCGLNVAGLKTRQEIGGKGRRNTMRNVKA